MGGSKWELFGRPWDPLGVSWTPQGSMFGSPDDFWHPKAPGLFFIIIMIIRHRAFGTHGVF